MSDEFKPDTKLASRAINEALGTLHAIQFVASQAEGVEGMSALSTLLEDLLPIIGGRLEAGWQALEDSRVGLFAMPESEGETDA